MAEPNSKQTAANLEPMAAFFDARSSSYDAHMRASVDHFEALYDAVARAVVPTEAAIRILDLGCGTGLELPAILERAPNAIITGIDLSREMLAGLRARFPAGLETARPTLHLVQGSYLDLPLGRGVYDYAVSVMTLHHLLPAPKRTLYRKLRHALKPRGRYVEGEWIVSPEEETVCLERYRAKARALGHDPAGHYHLDIPFSLATQQRLLHEAGFPSVNVLWQKGEAAVYEARTQ